ncbi:MAG TPA: hypothetical protein VMS86_15985 [Thermoanaerobaculia bacterium]|nr:hypothetical protein [Thermoanaerobaculia bacterium]
MPIRIGEQAWRGTVVGGALVVVGLAVSGAAVGANGSPPAAPASAGESESLAARLRLAAADADWEAVESGLDELERWLDPSDAQVPSSAATRADGSPVAPMAARRGVAGPLRHDREEARRSRSSRRGRSETWDEHWEHFGERMERHWSRVGERTADRGHDWEELGERAGERWGAFGERAGDRWSGFGARTGRRWSRIGNQMGRRFEEMAEDLPEAIELSIETVLDALDTLLASLGHE